MNTKKDEITIEEIFNEPQYSFWLKSSLLSALKRDCVDALADAELLRDILANKQGDL